MRSLIVTALGCFLATSLIACGGNQTGTSVVPDSHHSSGQVRRTRSTCTPDSQGYCAVATLNTVMKYICPHGYNWSAYFSGERDYDIYYNNAYISSATETVTGDCTNGTNISWDPAEPAVTYNDLNLP